MQDQTPNPQDLVYDEFLLQIQATQQIAEELDEGQEEKYEHNQMLCEAQEVRNQEKQKRQTTLAQFRNFCEWEANQETVRRLMDDSSSNT